MIQNIPAKCSVFLNIFAWFMCVCAMICVSYMLFCYLKPRIYIHVHTYPYVHNVYNWEDSFHIFGLFLLLSTRRNRLPLQNGAVLLSGCGDVRPAGCCLRYGCGAVGDRAQWGSCPLARVLSGGRTLGTGRVWTQPRDRPVLASLCTCLVFPFVPLSLCTYNSVANSFQSPTEDQCIPHHVQVSQVKPV